MEIISEITKWGSGEEEEEGVKENGKDWIFVSQQDVSAMTWVRIARKNDRKRKNHTTQMRY